MSEPTRPFQLHFELRPDYLYARVTTPDIDRETALEYLRQVAEEAHRVKANRILLERDIPVMLGDADLFFTTKDFLAMIGGSRVAFVNTHHDIKTAMDFAILIGVNRGGNYKLFSDVNAAETWLTSA